MWMSEVLAKVVEWQLEFAEGTPDECAAWLRAEREAGRLHVGEDPGRTEQLPSGKRVKTVSLAATKKAKR